MTNSQDATDRINWHAKKARGRVIATPRVPRPRQEEDALAEQSAVDRIKRHALAAMRRR